MDLVHNGGGGVRKGDQNTKKKSKQLFHPLCFFKIAQGVNLLKSPEIF